MVEWIGIGIMIAIGFYLAPMVIVGTLALLASVYGFLFGNK